MENLTTATTVTTKQHI